MSPKISAEKRRVLEEASARINDLRNQELTPEEAFGKSTGNSEEDERKVLIVLISAAKEAQEAEDHFLSAIAKWLGEKGDTFPTDPNPDELRQAKQIRFAQLLELSELGNFFTHQRLLKIAELRKKS